MSQEIDPSFIEEDEDEWEDKESYAYIVSTLPEGWVLIRVMAGWSQMADIREWLTENTTGGYREVGWESGCSYSVGVMLEQDMDIVLFKLRWNHYA